MHRVVWLVRYDIGIQRRNICISFWINIDEKKAGNKHWLFGLFNDDRFLFINVNNLSKTLTFAIPLEILISNKKMSHFQYFMIITLENSLVDTSLYENTFLDQVNVFLIFKHTIEILNKIIRPIYCWPYTFIVWLMNFLGIWVM